MKRAWPLLALLALTVVPRLPFFLNLEQVGSDAAIVGLQARHILAGEHAVFIWGADYQGALEAYLAAGLFLVLGDTPLALALVPFLGHLVFVACLWGVVRGRTSVGVAFLACLPLVVTPFLVTHVSLNPPRQWALTLVATGLWLAERRLERSDGRALFALAAGAALIVMSLFADLYAMQLVPAALLVLALGAGLAPGDRVPRLGALLVGAGAAAFLLGTLGDQRGGALGASLGRVAHNWPLFHRECLPWILGVETWVPGGPELVRWAPVLPVRRFMAIGGWSFFAALMLAPASVLVRSLPWPVRRLGLLGGLAAWTSVAGFLTSHWVGGLFSARYLGTLIWVAPLALAPWLAWLGARRGALALAPYLVIAALAGWMSAHPYVRGPLPVRVADGAYQEALALRRLLVAEGVSHAAAPYWVSYRLGFLFHESPVLMPFLAREDRYRPYRTAFAAARTVAYIGHVSQPDRVEYLRPLLLVTGPVAQHQVGGFTVLVQRR